MHHTETRDIVADLHVHSYLSRATSRLCDLPHLALHAQQKGISLLGTGDFTHSEWLKHIEEELVPLHDGGLFVLREDRARQVAERVPGACQAPVAFLLQVEISAIYKRHGKTRRVHNLVYLPDLASVHRFRAALGRWGRLDADGRPMLGLDSRDLLETVLHASPRGRLIPAHVWTPWYSVFGSVSGFDCLTDCFGDLTPHIFALETGLSSDPPMNWRLSALDGLTLVSSSDAHSPAKLGREATLIHAALTYDSVFDALSSKDALRCQGTLELFPEEGKYHMDGCRRCGARLQPHQTLELGGRCPTCGRRITVGVLHRIEALADRPAGHRPQGAQAFESLIPLCEILAECLGRGVGSKAVARAEEDLLGRLGPELAILRSVPPEALAKTGVPLLGEAIARMRRGEVHLLPGYDGEMGVARTFAQGERETLLAG